MSLTIGESRIYSMITSGVTQPKLRVKRMVRDDWIAGWARNAVSNGVRIKYCENTVRIK